MEKRKILLGVMVLALALMVFVGCSNAKTEVKSDEAETKVSETENKDSDEKESEVSESQKPELVLKYGELNPETHPMAKGAEEFARLIEEKTDGRIKIETYLAGQLGDEKTMMQSLQMGAVDMFRGNVVSMGDFGAEIFNVFGLPYVFRDLDHLSTVLRSDMGINMLDELQKADTQIVAIGYMEEGPRNMFFTKDIVKNLNDLKGLKVRVPETQLMMDTMEALGANPTPISYAELYTSLQTGVVDGAENGITGYATNNFFEVAPIYVKDAHTFGVGITLISEQTWDKLSDEDKIIFKEAATETMDFVLELSLEVEKELYKEVEEKGSQILEIEDLQAWQDAVKPVYETHAKEYLDMIEEIREIK